MQLRTNAITTCDMKQVAYPIGPNKDAYYIVTHFRADLEGSLEASHSVHLNMMGNKPIKLFEGTLLQSYEHINECIKEIYHNNTFDKNTALVLASLGYKVAHSTFTPDEWFTAKNSYSPTLVLEDGVEVNYKEFFGLRNGHIWNDGYSLFEDGL